MEHVCCDIIREEKKKKSKCERSRESTWRYQVDALIMPPGFVTADSRGELHAAIFAR